MSGSDQGYTILLSHLHNPATRLALSSVQGALAYQLANVSPIPTPLAALTVSSPFYLSQPFTYPKLHSLCTAFRHAIHLKYRALVESHQSRSTMGSLFGRTLRTALGQWVTQVLKGLQGGHAVLRLASATGLLLGVEDLKVGGGNNKNIKRIDLGSARSAVEDETVVAVAEVMDAYAYGFGSSSSNGIGIEEWEKEFEPAGQDILSLALILASQSLPLVHQHKLKALPLPTLARLLTSTISSTFKSGTFLSSVSASVTLSAQHHAHISTSSPLAQTLQSMASSPLTVSIASISRLTAITLALLIDEDGLFTVSESLDILQQMAKQVERDWIACPLASFTDLEIVPDSKNFTKSIWLTLKTLLFSNIMLAEAVLSASVFTPPRPHGLTPASLALQVLQTLSHLSFVISQFGGVTTTKGFEHLKKTFYLALDILAQGDGDGSKAEAYVQQVCITLNSQRTESAATSPRQAKQAFVLASIEQLVPVLSNKCIRDWVWGVCYPHLSDPSHRETYESAHSVVLSIFASHAQRQQHTGNSISDSSTQVSPTTATIIPDTRVLSGILNAGSDSKQGPEDESLCSSISNPRKEAEEVISANFVKRMIPFYAQCLVENSVDGKLSTSQLRLAYSALVRSAAMTSTGAPGDTYTLAWYCVQLLVDTVRDLSSSSPSYTSQNPKGKDKAQETIEGDNNSAKVDDRIYRLSLTLISTTSSLPLTLMLRALDEIRIIITAYPKDDSGVDGGNKDEASQSDREGRKKGLVEALFAEILEKIGDREKEAAIKWWYKYRPALISESGDDSEKGQEGQLLGMGSWSTKRRRGVEKANDVVAAGEDGEGSQSSKLSRL